MSRVVEGYYSIPRVCNGVLSGLVSITASCNIVVSGDAILIGIIGANIYYTTSVALETKEIDDPLDAFPVHGMCGVFGLLSVAFFRDKDCIKAAGYNDTLVNASKGYLFLTQLFGCLMIVAWVSFNSIILFYSMKKCNILRISKSFEKIGLDYVEHGGPAINHNILHKREHHTETFTEVKDGTEIEIRFCQYNILINLFIPNQQQHIILIVI